MGIVDSASSGVRLDTLRDLRDLLARNVEACESPRDLAALSARLQSVLSEIEELSPKESTGDDIDEIAKRRTDRRPVAAKGAGRTKRPG